MTGASLRNPVDASLWEATAPPAPDCPAFQGPAETEVALVGCGFLGAATALALAEAGIPATLLEAAPGPGGGASGRSGGQVIPGLRHDPAQVAAEYGPAYGARMDAVAAAGGRAVFDLADRFGIDCAASRSGWIQALDTAADEADGAQRVAWWRDRGADARLLPRDEMMAMTGSTLYRAGWLHAEGGSVQPLAYVRGLARAAHRAGARVHGASPVTAMERDGAGWALTTPGGRLRARRVLLTTNARDGGLWPGVAQSVLPVWSFQVATPPLSDERAARLLPGLQSVSDTRRVLSYFRRDGTGRMVMGGKGTLSRPTRLAQFATVRRLLARAYPELADEPLDFAWGGQVSVMPGRWPRLARLGPGAWSAMSCNGKGVALTTALAPHLAEMLAGGDEAASPLPPGKLAPIPFHGLRRAYVGAGSLWLRMQDALDRA